MRFITFVFLFATFSANCQPNKQKIEYTIDLITSDSFYLIERTFGIGPLRPDTSSRHLFFGDTSSFRIHVERIERDASRKEREYLQAKIEFDSLDARAKRLGKIAKDDLGMTGFKLNKKAAAGPDILAVTSIPASGFWVVYPVRGRYNNVKYVENITDIQRDAGILSENGIIIPFRKKKQKND